MARTFFVLLLIVGLDLLCGRSIPTWVAGMRVLITDACLRLEQFDVRVRGT